MNWMRRRLKKIIENILGAAAYRALQFILWLRPEPTGYRLARFLGGISRPVSKRPRMLNMMRAVLGPDSRTHEEWTLLMEEHLNWIGHCFVEVHYWMKLPLNDLRRRMEVVGRENLQRVLGAGRGAVLFCNHLGNFISFVTMVGAWADRVTAFGNRMPSPAMESDMQTFHDKVNVNRLLVGEGKSGLAADTLNKNGLVVTFCDLTTVSYNNDWLRFGRAESLVNLGPALLALKNGADVLCLTFDPLGGNRHRITIHPPLKHPESGDRREDARRMTQAALDICSRDLVKRPEQWWQWDAVRFREPEQ